MKITILVDNYATQLSSLSRRLLSEWGFAAYIHDHKILYDTGLTGTTLLNNMRALGINPNEPEYLVISHRHIDHTGGVKAFLNARSRSIKMIAHANLFTRAYAVGEGGKPEDISVDFTWEYLKNKGVDLILIKEPYKIANGVMVSGEIPRKWGPSHTGAVADEVPDDMALYMEHPNGLIVLTGCGHSGVENMVEYGFQVTGLNKLYAVIGGLHFMGLPDERVRQVTNYLVGKSPRIIVGTHCTGVLGIAALYNALPGGAFRLGGVGGAIFEL
ncbi:MBL fold metallo-hydrolase [Vulcanisaeta souniana]|uniref:MBL fold metallo-hydrolase n=1 Tax=Vulcanisaeta souniana TaxID=164452 RepID=UPI0006D221D4|nr:MBL fold metallo-hydrolase [Vulcanisaeta souniana]